MLMITSGSPKEPENEQRDAGQSQSSRIWDWNPKQSFAAIGITSAHRCAQGRKSDGLSRSNVPSRGGGADHRWAKGVLGVLRTSEGHLAFSRGHSWSGVAHFFCSFSFLRLTVRRSPARSLSQTSMALPIMLAVIGRPSSLARVRSICNSATNFCCVITGAPGADGERHFKR